MSRVVNDTARGKTHACHGWLPDHDDTRIADCVKQRIVATQIGRTQRMSHAPRAGGKLLVLDARSVEHPGHTYS